MSHKQLFFRHKSQRLKNFDGWLQTNVFLDEFDYKTVMPRKEALQIFFFEGLRPFVEDHGYIFDLHPNLSHLATFLFEGYRHDSVQQPFYRILNKINIDYLYYEDLGISQGDWELFWRRWGRMTDFYDDNQKNQYWIPFFCYNRFNLQDSETTKKVDLEYNQEFSDEEEGGGQLNENLAKVKDKKSMY